MTKHFILNICVCIIAFISLPNPGHAILSQGFLDEGPIVVVYWQCRERIGAHDVLQYLQASCIKQTCWLCCILESKSA